MGNAAVVREDGTRGVVVASDDRGQLIVGFDDDTRLVVPPHALRRQDDGTYRLSESDRLERAGGDAQEIVIPVVAEELTVEKELVDRGKVRVTTRVESHEETVETPVVREEIIVEHVTRNTLVEGPSPQVRDEDGVLVIPLLEEVTIVEKRLVLREEVRVSRRRTTTSGQQTVVLRREVVDVEREERDGVEAVPGARPVRKE